MRLKEGKVNSLQKILKRKKKIDDRLKKRTKKKKEIKSKRE